MLRPNEGDSRLPKPLTIIHFIREIADIVFLLNRIKGNDHAFHGERWMYLFILKIIEGEKFIDWADLIVETLHKGLISVSNFSPFFMYYFLVYILAASKEWDKLPHMPWTEEMTIYQYYNDLHATKSCKELRSVNDVFLGRLVFELQGHKNHKLSGESMQAIKIYGCFYIQFPKFTYLRIGDFSGEPFKFP